MTDRLNSVLQEWSVSSIDWVLCLSKTITKSEGLYFAGGGLCKRLMVVGGDSSLKPREDAL